MLSGRSYLGNGRFLKGENMNDKYTRNSSYRNEFLSAVQPVRGK